MQVYVIYKTVEGQNYIVMIEPGKEAAGAAEASGLSYVHWDTNISGEAPKFDPMNPAAWVDTRSYAEKRRCAYRMEVDTLSLEANGCSADGDNPNPMFVAWQDARAAIKQKYPKP